MEFGNGLVGGFAGDFFVGFWGCAWILRKTIELFSVIILNVYQ